ncbi:MAG: exonuclease SbcC [Gammaproteobacteria bacterium]|nr:MAG: exonuclease SbcC [Gammaproteobacteria bacterium]
MRILQLRFKNLNSLLGEWQIDLTDPAYGNDGIFAITGPTGAGKSTILDAICLALYGRTPRLSKITKSSNEIMSRHSGECFAEITFETPAGQFRCHWSQHRARKKAAGDLQSPKHEISDALSGQIIEAQIRKVAQRIEAITGMDFERFTLSMLLAQGSFAAFLQAAPDQRAPILEQITGSAIYSQISTRVHELRTIENNTLNTLQAQLSGMALLSTEDEAQLKTRLEQQQKNEAELNSQREQYSQSINWLSTIDSLQIELQDLDRQNQNLLTRRDAFKADEKKLDDGKRALQLAADYASLGALCQAQSSEQKTEQECRAELPAKKEALTLAEKKLQQSKHSLSESRNVQGLTLPTIRKTQALDLQAQAQQAPIDKAASALKELEQGLAHMQEQQKENSQKLTENKTHLSELVVQIAARQADETLVDQLSGLQSRFSSLRVLTSKSREKTEEHDKAKAECANTLATWQKQFSELAEKKLQLQQLIDRLALQQSKRLQTLDGQDITHWRKSQASLVERKQLLENLGLQLNALAQSQGLQPDLDKRSIALTDSIADSKQQLSLQTEKQESLERELELLETQVLLLNKIHSLEQAREQLEDGEPCPLCGANEHPYAEGNVPQADSASLKLNAVKAKLNAASQQLVTHKIRIAEDNKGLEQVSQQQRDTSLQITQQQKLIEQTTQQLSDSGLAPATQTQLAESLPQLVKDNRDSLNNTNQLLTTIEQQDQALVTLRASLETAKKSTNELEQQHLAAGHQKDTAEQTRVRLEKEQGVLNEQLEGEQQEALAALSIYGITTLPEDSFAAVENTLIKRREEWLATQLEKSSLDQSSTNLTLQIEHQNQQLSERSEELAKQRRDHATLLKTQEALIDDRKELFDDKDPVLEESRLADAVIKAEKQVEKDNQQLHAASQAATQLNIKIKAIVESLQNRTRQLNLAEEAFKQGLRKHSFVSEADFQSACLSDETREKLSREARQLSDEQSGLDARRKDRAERLKNEREKAITERAIEPLKQDLNNTTNQLKTTQQELGACQQKLNDNQNLRASQQERATAIDAQKIECQRWDNLHLLIGSADGKKYRNFAQGLTFELLVGHANRQLQKMSDRYLLIRDKREPLELNVVDNYQAGEIRSTKNLSGGESFIVSLALALGLSQMASKNVRVDSLFLDEGFGTLDEEALDTALEALSSLQQSGKLIGVISHVSSLKERIGTQIQVSPQTGGRSLISGPGCQRII